jgi:competence protein ComEC
LQLGDRLDIGGVQLRVQHPPPPDWDRQKVRNDDSLVFELRFGQVSIVLTGDISREVEAAVSPALDPLPIVVLKVPHHGSGTSSSAELLERLRPRIAMIGVGRGNPFGHPVPHVLTRYRQVGTDVFRTDIDGAISVNTDGHTVEVTSFTGRRVVAGNGS